MIGRRQSFRQQYDSQRELSSRALSVTSMEVSDETEARPSFERRSSFKPSTLSERMQLAEEATYEAEAICQPFESKFHPSEMRQLALVAHNHMKPAMKQFIETHSEILKKFRVSSLIVLMIVSLLRSLTILFFPTDYWN